MREAGDLNSLDRSMDKLNGQDCKNKIHMIKPKDDEFGCTYIKIKNYMAVIYASSLSHIHEFGSGWGYLKE